MGRKNTAGKPRKITVGEKRALAFLLALPESAVTAGNVQQRRAQLAQLRGSS